MNKAHNLPSHWYSFWLPVHVGDEYATRAIKRIVLREFRSCVGSFRGANKIVTVKNFQWIEYKQDAPCQCYYYSATFGWKAEIRVLEMK